jgi:hypothetical protein
MTTPNDLGSQLHNNSSPGRAPYGVQPNGRILYPVAWHHGDFNTPGITSTIPGTLGFQVVIACAAGRGDVSRDAGHHVHRHAGRRRTRSGVHMVVRPRRRFGYGPVAGSVAAVARHPHHHLAGARCVGQRGHRFHHGACDAGARQCPAGSASCQRQRVFQLGQPDEDHRARGGRDRQQGRAGSTWISTATGRSTIRRR